MGQSTATELARKRCTACEGGVPALSGEQLKTLLAALPAWKLTDDRRRIRREWRVQDFMAALDFFHKVGLVAEEENHHPDLHLVGYQADLVKEVKGGHEIL